MTSMSCRKRLLSEQDDRYTSSMKHPRNHDDDDDARKKKKKIGNCVSFNIHAGNERRK